MRLTLKKYPDGRLRPYWFGEYQRNGRRKVATLGRWKGRPPASESVADAGDAAFEASRQAALAMLDELCEGQQSRADKEALVQRIHSARYGAKVRQVPLASLTERWDHFPRRRKQTPAHRANCHRILNRFVGYLAKTDPDMVELGAVTAAHVQGFMDEEGERGLAPRTWNITLTILRAIFKRLEPFSDAWREYLAVTPAREERSVHREPFKADEIGAILEAGKADALIHALMVTALCTAMRRGDVCNLRWRHVDLEKGFVTVKTAKTGGTIEIPILPLLREKLNQVRPAAEPDRDAFVFPEAACIYAASPDALDRRLRSVLYEAGFVDEKERKRFEEERGKGAIPPSVPAKQALARGLKAIGAAKMTESRRERMKEILTRYLGGETIDQIAASMSSSKGIVSMRLHDVEKMTGVAVVRRPAQPAVVRGYALTAKDTSETRMRRGSLKGWHSFRTTWITLALSAGVPMELVCRVTGHATADIVLKHYFRPGREQFRAALQSAMPAELVAGPKSRDEEALEILRASTADSWMRDRDKLITLLSPG